MPLLSGLRQRAAAQRRAEERIRRAGEEMRTAPLPELAVQPARRGDAPAAPTPAAVVPLPRASVVTTETPRAPVVPAPVLIGVRQGPAGPATVHPIVIDLRDHVSTAEAPPLDASTDPPERPLTYRWETAAQLLRHLPRLAVDAHAGTAAATRPTIDGDDAEELLRRLQLLDLDVPAGEGATQGEFPIVLDAAGLMGDGCAAAPGVGARREA